jgi:hypothetical protein
VAKGIYAAGKWEPPRAGAREKTSRLLYPLVPKKRKSSRVSPRATRVGRRRRRFMCRRHLLPPAPHSPLPPASWPVGRRAGVHPLVDRVFDRVLLGLGFARRRCSAVELGFADGVWLLCGLVFLAVPAMRKRQRC